MAVKVSLMRRLALGQTQAALLLLSDGFQGWVGPRRALDTDVFGYRAPAPNMKTYLGSFPHKSTNAGAEKLLSPLCCAELQQLLPERGRSAVAGCAFTIGFDCALAGNTNRQLNKVHPPVRASQAPQHILLCL